ncbi:MAG TPA: uroporphyrinogen-III synthase, partial [Candidatus Dormibacteraeota bacterium]
MTRAAHQAEELLDLLRARGALPLSVPVLELEPLLGEAELALLREGIQGGRWDDVVFTSANAVRLVLPRVGAEPPAIRVFAIGPGTAALVEGLGWPVEALPESFIAESLAERLVADGVSGRRLLLPKAAGARPVLPRRLEAAGALVEEVEVYRMRPALRASLALERALAEPELDAVVFASASSVEGFRTLHREPELPPAVLVACIGPITAEAAIRAGIRPGLVAEEHSLLGLVAALEKAL